MASNLAAAAVEKTVLEATKAIEEQLDAEIDRLENLDDDELDRLRYKKFFLKDPPSFVNKFIQNYHVLINKFQVKTA